MIHFDHGSLHRSGRGSITGIIHFTFGETHFPGQNWSDFVVVILDWWISALKSNDRHITLQFMDGPYRIKITRESDGSATLDCVESRKQEVVVFSDRIRFKEFSDQVEEAGKRALATCHAQNWESDDLKGLASCLGLD
jgi:hypothetical protein